MSILPLALQAAAEGKQSSAYAQLKEKINVGERPYPYIVAVDFDGTMCESDWPEIGRENKNMLKVVPMLRELGAIVILWSCREEDDLQDAIDWCAERGVTFDAANDNCDCIKDYFEWNTRKIHADEYWDDKAVTISLDI